jgi:hypothetical protein
MYKFFISKIFKNKLILFLILSSFPTALLYVFTLILIGNKITSDSDIFLIIFTGLISVIEFGIPMLISKNRKSGISFIYSILKNKKILFLYFLIFCLVYLSTKIITNENWDYIYNNFFGYLIFTTLGVISGYYRGLTDRARSFSYGLLSRYITNLSSSIIIFLCAYGVNEIYALYISIIIRLISIPLILLLIRKHIHRISIDLNQVSVNLKIFRNYFIGSLLAFVFSGVLLRSYSASIMNTDEFVKFIYAIDISIKIYGFIFLGITNYIPKDILKLLYNKIFIIIILNIINYFLINNIYFEILIISINGLMLSIFLQELTVYSLHRLRSIIPIFEFLSFVISSYIFIIFHNSYLIKSYSFSQLLVGLTLFIYLKKLYNLKSIK